MMMDNDTVGMNNSRRRHLKEEFGYRDKPSCQAVQCLYYRFRCWSRIRAASFGGISVKRPACNVCRRRVPLRGGSDLNPEQSCALPIITPWRRRCSVICITHSYDIQITIFPGGTSIWFFLQRRLQPEWLWMRFVWLPLTKLSHHGGHCLVISILARYHLSPPSGKAKLVEVGKLH